MEYYSWNTIHGGHCLRFFDLNRDSRRLCVDHTGYADLRCSSFMDTVEQGLSLAFASQIVIDSIK